MKSKRVKKILPTIVESYELAGKGLGEAVAETLTVYVELAEQEAEERALKAFCVACTHYVDFSLCERKTCPELEEFRQLIGGQSDA